MNETQQRIYDTLQTLEAKDLLEILIGFNGEQLLEDEEFISFLELLGYLE